MRIKSITLEWFRGAADIVALEPNGKSMVVYGENGSGKSSFVDAVEYVLNNHSIEHLKNEYSGSRQENAIPNTHRPEGRNTALRFRFQDDSELKVRFNPNGSSANSGAEDVAMEEWEYRQTVLRQDEVSRFIHDTKGQKYSALLPLFGLHQLEFAAENLLKLARSIETESGLVEKRATIKKTEDDRATIFGTQSLDQILGAADQLHKEYCGDKPIVDGALSRCNETKVAIEDRIEGYSEENRRHLSVAQLAALTLAADVLSVRRDSGKLAGSLDPLISEKLAILQAANTFVRGLQDTETVACPACGQEIGVDQFREHVIAESERLREVNEDYNTYKASVGTLCDTLTSLKTNLNNPVLQSWLEDLGHAATADGLKFLNQTDIGALRAACSEDELKDIETKLSPVIASAEQDSKDVPPDVKKITDDRKRLEVAISVIVADDLKTDIKNSEALIALVKSMQEKVRVEIRRRSQKMINEISADIEAMWTTLHPGEKIDGVRLALPGGADKAIDVALKFHGLDQVSPRLTLSEGYRNSLGLCIFLAMAKRVNNTERPLFLDDVVVSLDRNHRGMIQELLEEEFSDRQVVILTHDREWYTELRQQLDGDNSWIFRTLLPYETPDIGIRWSHKTTTFDDARASINARPDSAVNDARKIMDVELGMIAERLQVRLPFLRSDKNDKRMAHDFLTRLSADGKVCFQKKSENGYVENTGAIEALTYADRLLTTWANRGSHTFDIVGPEATKVIDACETAIACFKCDECNPPTNVWRLDDKQSEYVQCRCGEIRWRYGKG